MTASEAGAGEALWRRLAVPQKERRQLLDAYRDAVLHGAAEKIRAWGEEGHLRLAEDENGYPVHRSPFYMWEDAEAAANLIDPEG